MVGDVTVGLVGCVGFVCVCVGGGGWWCGGVWGWGGVVFCMCVGLVGVCIFIVLCCCLVLGFVCVLCGVCVFFVCGFCCCVLCVVLVCVCV